MFVITGGASPAIVILVLLVLFGGLIVASELVRRYKTVGFFAVFVLPIILSILWFTTLSDNLYSGWFHLVKVYTLATACVGVWFIRYYSWKDKLGNERHFYKTKFAIIFPPVLLAANIIQAVISDFRVGSNFFGMPPTFNVASSSYVIGGAWNYMNSIAGILNVLAITGFVGITLRKDTENDNSRNVIWPDMLWLYIIPFSIWNFVFIYNTVPHRTMFSGAVVLIASIVLALTKGGKGSWIQHRMYILTLWFFFIMTFPAFTNDSIWRVDSTYNPTIHFALALVSLVANALLALYIFVKWYITKRNPYTGELHTDLKEYQEVKAMGMTDSNS